MTQDRGERWRAETDGRTPGRGRADRAPDAEQPLPGRWEKTLAERRRDEPPLWAGRGDRPPAPQDDRGPERSSWGS